MAIEEDKLVLPKAYLPEYSALPEYSEWCCIIFGFNFRPFKGEHPNWFWRKMQYLFFGIRWVKH